MTSATCVAVVATTTGPRRDLDYWWHVLLGNSLLARHTSPGSSWSVWPGDPHWRTAQPLAEMALATAERWWPASAPTTVRATTAALAMLTLALATTPWRAGTSQVVLGRWWAFACGGVAVLGFSQERPAQVGMICMPLVGMLAAWWATGRQASRRQWLLLGVATVGTAAAWTLSHQSWLLAWAVLASTAATAPRPWAQRAAAMATLAGVLAWSWWWVGSPGRALRTADAASTLAEWQATDFFTIPAAPATALVLGCAAAIACAIRSPSGLRWRTGDTSRYVALLILGVAGASAWRHVPVTVLASGPVFISLLTNHCGGGESQTTESARGTFNSGPPWKAPVIVGLSLTLSVVLVHLASQKQPAPATRADHVAAMAARHSCRLPKPAVIATHYNDSGPALAGARMADCPQAPLSKVVIDGRADRYGADALRRWQQVLNTEGPQWEHDWCMVDPDLAILSVDTPLNAALRARGWQESESSHGLVVLDRPDQPCGQLVDGVGVDAVE